MNSKKEIFSGPCPSRTAISDEEIKNKKTNMQDRTLAVKQEILLCIESIDELRTLLKAVGHTPNAAVRNADKKTKKTLGGELQIIEDTAPLIDELLGESVPAAESGACKPRFFRNAARRILSFGKCGKKNTSMIAAGGIVHIQLENGVSDEDTLKELELALRGREEVCNALREQLRGTLAFKAASKDNGQLDNYINKL
jgi:hypothetical protein